jgi:hypothetical protein
MLPARFPIRGGRGATLWLRQIAKRRRGMPFGIVHGIGVCDLAVRPDHDSDAGRFFLIGTFGSAVGNGDGFIDVAKQFAWKTYFLAPFLQVFRRAEGDPQNDGVFIGKFLGSSTEPIGLLSSIIAERAWIEPQHDVFASVIRQAHILPVLIGQRESRRHASDFR